VAEQVRVEQPLALSVHASHRGIESALDDIVLTCLQRDPARRYADAGALDAELRRWLSGEPIAARGAARRIRWLRWLRWRRMGRSPWLAAIAGGLLVAGVGVWSTWSATGDHAILVPTAAEQPANTDAAMACQQHLPSTGPAQAWTGWDTLEMLPLSTPPGRCASELSVRIECTRHLLFAAVPSPMQNTDKPQQKRLDKSTPTKGGAAALSRCRSQRRSHSV